MKSTQRRHRSSASPAARAMAAMHRTTLNWIARPGANQGSAERCRRGRGRRGGCGAGAGARGGGAGRSHAGWPRPLRAPLARGAHSSSERAPYQPPPSGMSILLLVFARNAPIARAPRVSVVLWVNRAAAAPRHLPCSRRRRRRRRLRYVRMLHCHAFEPVPSRFEYVFHKFNVLLQKHFINLAPWRELLKSEIVPTCFNNLKK